MEGNMDKPETIPGSVRQKEFKAAICPNCGGELQLDDSREQAFCMYCGSKILVKEAVRKVCVDNQAAIENLMKAAQIAYKAGDYHEAEERYSRVLEMDPDNYEAVFWEGVCLGRENDKKARELVKYAEVSLEMFSKIYESDQEILQRKNDMGKELLKVAEKCCYIRYYVIKLLDNQITCKNAEMREQLECLINDTLQSSSKYDLYYLGSGEVIPGNEIRQELENIRLKLKRFEDQEKEALREAQRIREEQEQSRYWAEHYDELLEETETLKQGIIKDLEKVEDYRKKADELIRQIRENKETFQKSIYWLIAKKMNPYRGKYYDTQILISNLEGACDDALIYINEYGNTRSQLVLKASYLKNEDRENLENCLPDIPAAKGMLEKLKEQAAELNDEISRIVEKKTHLIKRILCAGAAIIAVIVFAWVNYHYRVTVPRKKYNEGVNLFYEGKYTEAKKLFDQLGYQEPELFQNEELLLNRTLEYYLQGQVHLESGNYKYAAEDFEKAGYFRDAKEMTQECSYKYAEGELNNHSYNAAADEFEKLLGYKDSDELLIDALLPLFNLYRKIDSSAWFDEEMEIKQRIKAAANASSRCKEAVIAEADRISEEGDSEKAAEIYQIIDYNPEPEMADQEIIYQSANKLMDDGVYVNAINKYLKIRNYQDTEYKLGLAYYKLLQYKTALEIWEGIQDKADYPELEGYIQTAKDKLQKTDGNESDSRTEGLLK